MLNKVRPLLMLFGGTFGSALFSMGAQLILARTLDVAQFGLIAAILAAVNLLSPVAGFGLNWFWIQAFGKEGYRAYRWMPASARLLMFSNAISILALAAYVIVASKTSPSTSVLIAALAIFVLLGQCAVEIASAKFQLQERFAWLALWQALPQFGRLLVALALAGTAAASVETVLYGYGLVGVMLLAFGVGSLVQLLRGTVDLAGHRRADEERAAVSPGVITTAKLAFPFAFITVFYLIYFQSSIVLLNAMIGPRDTALFSAALLIMSAIYLVPNIVFTKFLMGRICRWAEHDVKSFDAILHVGVVGMAVSGMGLMALVMVGAPALVPLMFGAKYAASIEVLVWLAPTIPFRFVQSAYSAMLVSDANVRRRVSYAGVSALVSLSLNLLLLPTLGLRGAVLASIASEAALMFLNMWGVHRHVEGVAVGASYRPAQIKAAIRHLAGLETPTTSATA